MCYTVVQQVITTYGLETITPWMLNQLQNSRVATMRESSSTSLIIVTVWYMYMWVGRVVSIQILLSQIDFLLCVLVVDLATTVFVAKYFYLKYKRCGVIDLLLPGASDLFRGTPPPQR